MIAIKVTTLGSNHTMVFHDMESAEHELKCLREALNTDKYARNEKRENVHTMQTPQGPVDLVLEHVHMARIVDEDVWAAMTADHDSEVNDRQLRLDLKHRRAILELENSYKTPAQ